MKYIYFICGVGWFIIGIAALGNAIGWWNYNVPDITIFCGAMLTSNYFFSNPKKES